MTIHIMLDLETWGIEPGCDIRSIGACMFDPLGGTTCGFDGATDNAGTFYIACDNPLIGLYGDQLSQFDLDCIDGSFRRYNLTRNPETVKWWNDQSEEARAAFNDPIDLREALKRFDDWLTVVAPDQRVILNNQHSVTTAPLWSHGAAFDPPILAAAYKACGLPVPWHYRAPRDTRTAFDMAGIEDHSAHLKQFSAGTFHHALDDAICQARAVVDAYARVQAGANCYYYEHGVDYRMKP